jgi:hypothetical protein
MGSFTYYLSYCLIFKEHGLFCYILKDDELCNSMKNMSLLIIFPTHFLFFYVSLVCLKSLLFSKYYKFS